MSISKDLLKVGLSVPVVYGSPSLEHSIINPNVYGKTFEDYFGSAVAIDGPTTIVGARGEGDNAGLKEVGTVYVFDTSTGTLLRTLDNPDVSGTAWGDHFGNAVAIDGNTAIVGARMKIDASEWYSGEAYIFNTSTGALLHTLDNPNSYGQKLYDHFGDSVGISGNYAIVSATGEDDITGQSTANQSSGKAYIFNVSTGALLHILDNPNAYGTTALDAFGYSAAIGGNYAIVGAPFEDDADGSGSGKAYIFDATTGLKTHTLDNPDAHGTGAGDNFGWAVSISGNYAIVGAMGESDADGPQSGVAYIFNVSTGALVHTIVNPSAYSTGSYDRFGHSVSISGNYAVVGAYLEDAAGGFSLGKAYIFDVTTGALLHILDNPDGATGANDQFGHSVAIDGTSAIVSTQIKADSTGFASGKAYIFDVSTGLETFGLDNPSDYGSVDDKFSTYVGISNDYAIVGAHREEDAGGENSGKAYIFNITNGAIAHVLSNPNAYSSSVADYFGTAVAISGNYAIVGAWGEDASGASDSGNAYIFNVSTGALVHTLDNPSAYGSKSYDRFGQSAAIGGNYAIVGAPQEDDADGNSSGKAYIFNVSTGALLHILDNPDAYGTGADDGFGYSVAISGNYAIVGAYKEDDADGTSSGKAYIFDATTGVKLYTLDNPDAYGTGADDGFGYSVAIDGNYAIVGAHGEDDADGPGSGKAYIFDVTTGALLYTLDNPDAYDTGASDQFGKSVNISGNHAIVGAPAEEDADGLYSGKAYIFDVTTGALLYILDNPDADGISTFDNFSTSVSIHGPNIIVGAPNEEALNGESDTGIVYIYDMAQ